MNILRRFHAAWLAFKDPNAYWEGVSIRKIADELVLKRRLAFIKGDPETQYTVHMLAYDQQRAIESYLGITV